MVKEKRHSVPKEGEFMKKFVVAIGCAVALSACAGMNLGGLKNDVTVGYSISADTGQASFSAVSKHCGVLATGVANVDRGVAACVTADEGTALVGSVSGKVSGK